MTGVAERLAATADASAPIQRVRNYHLTDREASPRPRDFLTAMKRTDGAVCVRWPGPPGDCVVRYAAPNWECAKHNRFRGRTRVETIDADRVRSWLRQSNPELVAHERVRDTFEEGCSAPEQAHTGTELADGTTPADDNLPTDGTALADGGEHPDEGPESERRNADATPNHVLIEREADLVTETELHRVESQALAAALPAAPREVVFRLPLVLAEESVLESVPGSDRVFVGEVVPERETECAYYVRQARRGCWVPKGEATTYEVADGVTLDVDPPESSESPESA